MNHPNNSILKRAGFVAAFVTAGFVARAQETPSAREASIVVADENSGAEKIGLMPYQKTPVDVGTKERNPFANRAPEAEIEAATEENKEEDRIRLVLSDLPIGGVSRGKEGGLRVLLGDMKLERGAVVPQVLEGQTAQLMVALVTEEKIEFAWLEESGRGTGRRLVLPIDIEPKVSFVLNGQHGKEANERAMGYQIFPSHHSRDPGVLSESIGSLEPQFAPK